MEKEFKSSKETPSNFIILNEEVIRLSESKVYDK